MAASLYDIDLSRGVIQDRAVQSYFNLALELSDTDKALALIAHCDASGFVIKDAYSRIASILYSENKNHRSFIDMSSKDLLHGDISPKFSMMLAKAYALLDDAENAVKMADYTCSICNQTKDIYSSIASILYFEKKDFRSFIEMSSKDLPSGRISPTYSMMLAKAYALLDDAENSVKMADYTCSICNQTKDVYSRIANILYLKKKDFRSFIELSSKDLPDGRISPTSSMLLAKAYAMLNDAENSVKMVEYTYSICPETKDGFSLIAANLSITTPSEDIFSLYKRDIELGRMTSYGASQLASFLVESDRADSLTEIGELLYSAFPDISDFYSSAASVQFEKMNIEEAFRLYEMDFSLDKISAEHMSAYIRSLAKFGRINKAFELLKDCMDKDSIFYPPAYSELLPHPDIKNIEPPEIKQLSAEDESIHNLALYYASASRFVDSNIISEKVNQLYEAAERFKDVFSSCARAALEDGNIEKAKKYFELDYKKKRMEYYSYFQYSEIIDSEKPKKYGFSILSSGGKKDRWLQNSKDMHKGESCFVVGTGPSLKDVDTSMLKKCPVFGVNGVFYKEGLNITYYTTISNFFWHHHTEQIKNVKCERRFILDRFKNELSSHVPTSWINSLPPEYKDIAGQKMLPPFFFSKNPEKAISLGGTVLFVCLQLAFHMGFKKVYLLGADHNYGQPESINKAGIQNIIETESQPMHFSGNQFPQGFFPIDMQGCEKAFNISKSVFEADGRKIFNATKGSRLNIFEKVNLEDIV
ncbi:MAG: hypothetical protein C0602_03855 [Denitrovibrio sp.]|nr:MAG: hypothetical protein C0602_03855 [Denitrovibrio sp.]